DRDDRYGNDRYSGNSFTPRERDAAIRMINHEFDDRIWAVRRSRYLSQFDKERQIRFLNAQRVQEIRRVNDRFNDRRNGYYDNRSYRNNRRF
ncbi:MAG TPA: hypothetical protein VFR58_11065, partial [Flavisolibacter sp.]|nr:hypothetical protein [Flavisolibacter sp.]